MTKSSKAQIVDIGYASAREYFDSVATSTYSKFLRIKSQENAIEVAKVLWDLHAWLWRDTYPGVDSRSDPDGYKAFTSALIDGCPELELIRDVAESAKHGGQLGRPSVRVSHIGGAGSPGSTEFVSGPFGTTQCTPECTLELVLKDNTVRKLPEVLARAVTYWSRRLS